MKQRDNKYAVLIHLCALTAHYLSNFAKVTICHFISSTFVRFPFILQPCTFFNTKFSFLLSTAA